MKLKNFARVFDWSDVWLTVRESFENRAYCTDYHDRPERMEKEGWYLAAQNRKVLHIATSARKDGGISLAVYIL